MPRVLAAADIGSNTAHLLVASTDGTELTRLANENLWIPLGEVVTRYGIIPDEHQLQLVQAIKRFLAICTAEKAESLYVFATEGMRAAANHDAVLWRIRDETGIAVDLIPPRREAELSLRGVQIDCNGIEPAVLFEVGGGSAQIAHVVKGHLKEKFSVPLGTGRLIGVTGITSPTDQDTFQQALKYITEQLRGVDFPFESGPCVASGGVARGLWRALHPDGDREIGLAELDYVTYVAQRCSIDTLIRRFSVKPKRAGTLLPGALVYSNLLRKFGFDRMTVSEYGVREGAILEMAAGRVEPCLV